MRLTGQLRDDEGPALAAAKPPPDSDVAKPQTLGGMASQNEIYLGCTVAGGQAISLPCSVLPTHITVIGAAGSGKTWLAKVLVEEAVLQGIPVVAVDPQGDLVQFLRQRGRAELPHDQHSRYDAFSQKVETRILTPASSHATRVSLSPIRLAKAEETRRRDGPAASGRGTRRNAEHGGQQSCQPGQGRRRSRFPGHVRFCNCSST